MSSNEDKLTSRHVLEVVLLLCLVGRHLSQWPLTTEVKTLPTQEADLCTCADISVEKDMNLPVEDAGQGAQFF
jgi:hypothetical protein